MPEVVVDDSASEGAARSLVDEAHLVVAKSSSVLVFPVVIGLVTLAVIPVLVAVAIPVVMAVVIAVAIAAVIAVAQWGR